MNVKVIQIWTWVFNTSLQKIAMCHTNCRCEAERHGPWTSCFLQRTSAKEKKKQRVIFINVLLFNPINGMESTHVSGATWSIKNHHHGESFGYTCLLDRNGVKWLGYIRTFATTDNDGSSSQMSNKWRIQHVAIVTFDHRTMVESSKPVCCTRILQLNLNFKHYWGKGGGGSWANHRLRK